MLKMQSTCNVTFAYKDASYKATTYTYKAK